MVQYHIILYTIVRLLPIMAILWNFTIINLTVVFWGYGNLTILCTVIISSNFTEVTMLSYHSKNTMVFWDCTFTNGYHGKHIGPKYHGIGTV